MRPGNRWNGEAASRPAAAVYGAVVALAAGYLLNFALGRVGIWVVHGHNAWDSPRYLMRAALNLYAEQHVPLIGSGTVDGQLGPMHVNAALTLPLTLCALIPFAALMLGGYAAARSRSVSGRWAMIAPALAAGFIYMAVLAAAARFISAQFTSVALPEFTTPTMSTQFNPPQIPFHPSIAGTIGYCIIFALILTYLGALIAIRSSSGEPIAGKWWACTKAVIVTALVVQLIVAAAGLFACYHEDVVADYTRTKCLAILPTAAGIGYSLIYGASLSYGGGSPAVQATYYSSDLNLYRGATSNNHGKIEHKSLGRYVIAAALLGGFLVLASGRLAVKWGSRDGSLPTAARITILQGAYLVLQMLFCGMSLGSGQFQAFLQPHYNGAMLLAAVGIFILSLIGAHWANRRYIGRLSGFPAA